MFTKLGRWIPNKYWLFMPLEDKNSQECIRQCVHACSHETERSGPTSLFRGSPTPMNLDNGGLPYFLTESATLYADNNSLPSSLLLADMTVHSLWKDLWESGKLIFIWTSKLEKKQMRFVIIKFAYVYLSPTVMINCWYTFYLFTLPQSLHFCLQTLFWYVKLRILLKLFFSA
jgi:hypothetical protein